MHSTASHWQRAASGGNTDRSRIGTAQAIAEWILSKRGELAQFMAVPAVTVFGREFDLRKMNSLSLTDTVRIIF